MKHLVATTRGVCPIRQEVKAAIGNIYAIAYIFPIATVKLLLCNLDKSRQIILTKSTFTIAIYPLFLFFTTIDRRFAFGIPKAFGRQAT